MIHQEVDENYKEFENFTHKIKEYFQQSNDTIADKRNVIKRLEHKGKTVIVKSFKVPNFINKFAYRFIRDSKAKRSYLNAKKLRELDIHTPQPISYIEFFTPLLENSFYICEYFDYDFEIRDVLRDEKFKDREKILEEFAYFSYNLHQKGVYHIDYSPGNVLIKVTKEGYLFSIIDVNRMKFIEFDDTLRFKNLSRFSATDNDTKLLAKYYAKIANIEPSFAEKELFFHHHKHQKYLQNKKRLKKIKNA